MPLDDLMQANQAPTDDGPDWPNHHMEPVDHDPFNDPESVEALKTAIMQVDQRLYSMEMVVAQSVNQIRDILDRFEARLQGLHEAHGDLQRTIAAPRKIVRDQDGRPTGVTIDHEPQTGPIG